MLCLSLAREAVNSCSSLLISWGLGAGVFFFRYCRIKVSSIKSVRALDCISFFCASDSGVGDGGCVVRMTASSSDIGIGSLLTMAAGFWAGTWALIALVKTAAPATLARVE